jgi:hypothetical protein
VRSFLQGEIVGMNYENFTDSGLSLMHEAVHKAIAVDAAAIKRGGSTSV